MKKLSKTVQNNVTSQLKQGKTIRQVAKSLGIGKSSVQRISKNLQLEKKSNSGRPKKMTNREETFCVKKIVSGEAKSVKSLTKELKEQFGKEIGRNVVSRALKNAGLKSGEKKKKPALSSKNMKARFEFAKKHQDWTVDDWNRVIFSDESKINRFNSDGRSWCWFRNPGELNERTVKQNLKFGGGGIMVWGCMTSKGVGYLCKIEGNMDQGLYKSILEDDLMKTLEYYDLEESTTIFQHDNDPKHKAKSVQNWLSEQKFSTLDWPAQSPDLNPIEHLWSEVKRRLNKYDRPSKGVLVLWERVEKIWNEIGPDVCTNLYNSIPNRIQSVIKAKGGWTKY